MARFMPVIRAPKRLCRRKSGARQRRSTRPCMWYPARSLTHLTASPRPPLRIRSRAALAARTRAEFDQKAYTASRSADGRTSGFNVLRSATSTRTGNRSDRYCVIATYSNQPTCASGAISIMISISLSGWLSPRAREPNNATCRTPWARKVGSFSRSLAMTSGVFMALPYITTAAGPDLI